MGLLAGTWGAPSLVLRGAGCTYSVGYQFTFGGIKYKNQYLENFDEFGTFKSPLTA